MRRTVGPQTGPIVQAYCPVTHVEACKDIELKIRAGHTNIPLDKVPYHPPPLGLSPAVRQTREPPFQQHSISILEKLFKSRKKIVASKEKPKLR